MASITKWRDFATDLVRSVRHQVLSGTIIDCESAVNDLRACYFDFNKRMGFALSKKFVLYAYLKSGLNSPDADGLITRASERLVSICLPTRIEGFRKIKF